MNIVLTGATGFIGKPLCARLAAEKHTLTVLTRQTATAAHTLPEGTRLLPTDFKADGAWQDAVSEADAVVNLAGESIGGARWTPEVKARLRASRIETTRAVVTAMQRSARSQVLVSGSAVGYYGDTGDKSVPETTPPGTDFLAQLCVEWEAEAQKAAAHGARVVLIRTGIVLGHGGALQQMVAPYRFFAGGPIGSGRQWLPWIHLEDEIGMIVRAIEDPAVRGAINLTAPHPVTMRDFATTLGSVLHRPSFLPAPAFALKLLLGEFADSLLGGQKAVPEVATRVGFSWKYPELEPALRSILGGK